MDNEEGLEDEGWKHIPNSKLAMQNNEKNLRNVEILNLDTRVIVCSGTLDCKDEIYVDSDWDSPDCHLCGEEIIPNADFMYRDNQRFEAYWRDGFTWGDHEANYLVGSLQCVYCFNYFHRHKCSLSMSDNSVITSYLNKSWACPLCVPEFIPAPQILMGCIFNTKDNDEILRKLFKIINQLKKIDNVLSAVELIRVKMVEFFNVNVFEVG